MLSAAFSISPPQSLAVAGRRRSIFSTRISVTARASAPASAPASSPSLYQILGLPSGANAGEIKAAYRRLARKCHPDAGRDGASADEFMQLHAAYSTLSDPDKRADYDRRIVVLCGRRHSPFAASASFPGYGRRTWETDQCW